MKQAVMTQPGKIEFRDVEKPAIQPDEVLIQTRRIGVCGSDIHVFHGLHPYTSYPVVQGHEIGGVIAEVGAGVQGFAPGDKVVFMPQVTCGECYPCRHGMYHICDNLKVMGFQTGGAAQEFIPVKADMVLIGEVGLSGELRWVGQMNARLREAAKLGFKTALIPRRVRPGEPLPKEIEVKEARSLREALGFALLTEK